MRVPKVTYQKIGKKIVLAINAREIHAFLKEKEPYQRWIKRKIKEFKFKRGKHYTDYIEPTRTAKGYRNVYFLTIDATETIVITGGGPVSFEVRDYLVDPMEFLTKFRLSFGEKEEPGIIRMMRTVKAAMESPDYRKLTENRYYRKGKRQ